jgi:thiosulfate/3-mercaptopyruvate sulfurtransferase
MEVTLSHAKVLQSQSTELIAGLSSGHIPGSISLPFQKLIDPETGKYKDTAELRTFFEKELDPSKETIASCGTGASSRYISNCRCYCEYHLSSTRSKWISFKKKSL